MTPIITDLIKRLEGRVLSPGLGVCEAYGNLRCKDFCHDPRDCSVGPSKPDPDCQAAAAALRELVCTVGDYAAEIARLNAEVEGLRAALQTIRKRADGRIGPGRATAINEIADLCDTAISHAGEGPVPSNPALTGAATFDPPTTKTIMIGGAPPSPSRATEGEIGKLTPADLAKALRNIGINDPAHDWTMQEATIMIEQLASRSPAPQAVTDVTITQALINARCTSGDGTMVFSPTSQVVHAVLALIQQPVKP